MMRPSGVTWRQRTPGEPSALLEISSVPKNACVTNNKYQHKAINQRWGDKKDVTKSQTAVQEMDRERLQERRMWMAMRTWAFHWPRRS